MAERVLIRSLDLYYLRPRWQLLRVSTDAGVDGWSEAVLEGNLQAVRGAVEVLADYLVGKDARAVSHHWTRMYSDNFYRGGPVLTSAISAVDIALWDIKGKLLGVPVYELFGGPVRDAVPVYCHINGDTAEELIADARGAIEAGFRILKTGLAAPAPRLPERAYVEREVERFYRLREAIGSSYEFAIDFHGRATPALSMTLTRELEGAHPFFVEEPCLPENVEAMREVKAATTLPIATGERLYTRWGFRPAIEARIADVYQPDVCHAGGISELTKIAVMADAHYAQIAPHNPLGPVALAASLQVDCACENILAQELVRSLGAGLLKQPFELVEGMIPAPQGPGLGVEVDLEALEELRDEGSWRTPTLSYPDGSVAPW
ncbi:MAG TPA: galactonate dehydratase [Acidimicrobiales bacterium]|nr:galactonate dehydratase [Acidimicrobiales bacterium]